MSGVTRNRLWKRGEAVSAATSQARRGLTLYEVFLALLILLVAMSVLSQHITVGTRAGTQGQLQTQAAMLCKTRMAAVAGGVQPPTPVSNVALAPPHGTGWTWSLAVGSGSLPNLMLLSGTVSHVNVQGKVDASFTLNRYYRNPQVFVNAKMAAAAAAQASEESESGGSQ